MASEILKKGRAAITAQSSSALTAAQYPEDGSYAADSNCTTINNTIGSTNGNGADFVVLELDVTTAPSNVANSANIYYRGSDNGSTWTDWRYSHVVGRALKTAADRYDAGDYVLRHKHTQLCVAAVGYNFTSVLYAYPKLYEAQ